MDQVRQLLLGHAPLGAELLDFRDHPATSCMKSAS